MRKQHWKKILLWVTPPCSQATLRLLLWVVLQSHFLGPCHRKQHHRKPKLFWHILFNSECLRRQNYFRVVTHQNNFEPEIVLVMVKLNSSKYPNMLDLLKLFWKMILVGGPPSNNFIKAGGIIWTCENEPPVRDVSQILKVEIVKTTLSRETSFNHCKLTLSRHVGDSHCRDFHCS